jgi:hypothetical protein
MSEEPITKTYKVIIERIIEEVIEVEGPDEITAIENAISGEGELVSEIEFSPTIVHSEEID